MVWVVINYYGVEEGCGNTALKNAADRKGRRRNS